MSVQAELQKTIEDMVDDRRGLLAADESTPTITKRFDAVGIESTAETRRQYRSLLLSGEGVGDYISGVILYEETLDQKDDQGRSIPELAASQGVVPGIKVDKGKGPLPGAPGDEITYGLDGLAERLRNYKEKGARFTKWREVYPITDRNPTALGLRANAEMLARYAMVCQQEGFVPIVEPEVLIDGDHSMERSAEVNEQVWHSVFHALHEHGASLEHLILKPSMVTPGKAHPMAAPEQVAEQTLRTLRRTVPAAVPAIMFLSGGQTPEQATANLDAMNRIRERTPWHIGFSYARALQQPVMEAWKGNPDNVNPAQEAFLKRARLNATARQGEYEAGMETA